MPEGFTVYNACSLPVDGGHCKREYGHAEECSLRRRPALDDALCPGCKKNPRGQSSPYCIDCYLKWQKPRDSWTDTPAHDAPQVERYGESGEAGEYMGMAPFDDGEWVKYADYEALKAARDVVYRVLKAECARLEAEKQQLEDENRKLRGARRINELDNHHNAAHCPYCQPTLEADAARYRETATALASLREAVREWAESDSAWRRVDHEQTNGKTLAGTDFDMERAATRFWDARTALRTLVLTPQPEKEI